MAKQLNENEESSKKKLVTKDAFTGTGPGYKKRRLGLLSNEIDAKVDTYDKEGKISKSSEIKYGSLSIYLFLFMRPTFRV